MFENSAFTGGQDNMRLAGWLVNDTGAAGYTGTSAHYGMIVNGTQGAVSTPQSQIVFDPQSTGTGGIALWGYNQLGITVNGGGLTTAQNGLAVTGTLSTSGSATVGGTLTTTGTATMKNGLTIGVGSSMVTQASAGVVGGTLNGDPAGDVVLGTQVGGGRVKSTIPLTFVAYAYVALSTAGNIGTAVFCSNCLKPGENAGSGTGMLMLDDGKRWISTVGTAAAD